MGSLVAIVGFYGVDIVSVGVCFGRRFDERAGGRFGGRFGGIAGYLRKFIVTVRGSVGGRMATARRPPAPCTYS